VLRHLAATLAYRAAKVLRDATPATPATRRLRPREIVDGADLYGFDFDSASVRWE
jgi:hypothetical protein